MLLDQTPESFEDFFGALLQGAPPGTPRPFDDEHVYDLLALSLLACRRMLLGQELSPKTTAVLGHFFEKVGVHPSLSTEACRAAIATYLDEHPLPEALVERFFTWTQRQAGAGGGLSSDEEQRLRQLVSGPPGPPPGEASTGQ